jgi:hypothetical protein
MCLKNDVVIPNAAKLREERAFPKTWSVLLVTSFSARYLLYLSDHSIDLSAGQSWSNWSYTAAISVFGVLGGLLGIAFSAANARRRFINILGFALAGGFAAGILFSPISRILEESTRFPPNQTVSYRSTLRIIKSYEINSRYRSWFIVTDRFPNHLRIGKIDADFISKSQSNLKGANVCVTLLMQKSSNNVRVMRTTLGTLPSHSVISCE